MRNIVLIVAVAAVGMLIFVMTDESLSPSARELSSFTGTEKLDPSKAYRILLGIHAAEEENAYAVGSELIQSYQQASAGSGPFDDIEFSEYPDESAIYVPSAADHELYCVISESGCLDKILADKRGRRGERERLSTIVERYIAYLTSNDFRSELPESVNTPWPEYRYVLTAARMRLFDAFDLMENGYTDVAIEELLKDTQLLRQTLAASDTVVHKLITTALIRDNFEAIAYLHSVGEGKALQPIDYLTAEELSFEKPLRNEFFMFRDIIEAMDRNPDKISEELDTPAWLSQMAFRPNKMTNVVADRINKQTKLSQVDPAAFSAAVNDLSFIDSSHYSLFPTINETMANIFDVHYEDYVGRLFDLNAKIALVNAQITGQVDSLTNPYYSDDEVALHIDDDSLNVCMDGPLPDKKKMRCLDIVSIDDSLVSDIVE